MVIVGPSGCGKSTTLRMTAGLEEISEGEIHIGERLVNRLDPRERDVAMVFQNYALYPHMSVFDNLAFPLRAQHVPKAEVRLRVERTSTLLGLDDLLKRKPKALSGGQRQRVAMGRAIVREPQAFLMDEPLSNLDAQLRTELRSEIAGLQRRARRHDDVRHARPGGGDDDGDADGRDAKGDPPAARAAAGPLRRA